MEDLIIHVFKAAVSHCKESLTFFERELKIPTKPFPRYSSKILKEKWGSSFEQLQSNEEFSPFWITDFKREFYDKEDPSHSGTYINYDLLYPEGFNEGLSGGEREFEYAQIKKRITEDGLDPAKFKDYLDYARNGKLSRSAGGGLGLERLLRYIIKAPHISEVRLFPRVPGKKLIF